MKLIQLTNNFRCLVMPHTFNKVWFSYETPIAFTTGDIRIIRNNDWGVTTGKHINDVKSIGEYKQVDGQEFEKLLKKAFI